MGFLKRFRKRRQERKAAEQAAMSMFDSNGNVAIVAGCMPSTRMPSLMQFQVEQESIKREESIASSSLLSATTPPAQHRTASADTSNTFNVEDEDDRSNSVQSVRSNSRSATRDASLTGAPEDSNGWTTPTKLAPATSASLSFQVPDDENSSATSSRSRLSLPGKRTLTKARADFWQHQAFNSTPAKREHSPSPPFTKADTPSSAASSYNSQFTSTTTSTPNTSSTAATTPVSNVQRKRQWLQKAFSPEGAGNMTQELSNDELFPPSPPQSPEVQLAHLEEDYYFMETSVHTSISRKTASSKMADSSKKSKEMDFEQHGARDTTTTQLLEDPSSTSKEAKKSAQTEQKTITEVKRIVSSPQLSSSSLGSAVPERKMDDYEAYRVWHAMGLLSWAPTKPAQQQEDKVDEKHEALLSSALEEDKTDKASSRSSFVRVRTVIDDSDDSSSTDGSDDVADFYDDSEDHYPTFSSRDHVLQHTEHLLMEMDSSTAESSSTGSSSSSYSSSPPISPDSSSHSGVRAVIPSLMDTVHEASQSTTDDDSSNVEVSPVDCNVSDLTAPTPPRRQLIQMRSKESCKRSKLDELQIPEDTSTTQQEWTEESTSSSAVVYESPIESIRLQWQVQEYIDVIREHRHLVREKSRQAPILSLFGTTKSEDLVQAQAVTAKSQALQDYAKNFEEYKKQRLEQRRLREERRREKEEQEQIQQTKEALAWLEALKQQMLVQHEKETAARASSTASGTTTASTTPTAAMQ